MEKVTKINLTDAFKALDELEIPVVESDKKLSSTLVEAIKKAPEANALTEDYYEITDPAEMEEAKEDREEEIAQAKLAKIEKIVDLDAESPEDLQPSYVGKTIIQCPQCMTLIYKDPADVTVSEEDPSLVNVGEVCQHCGNDSGYTVIGKVAEEEPVEETSTEEPNELDLNFEEPAEDEENKESGDLDLDLDLNLEEPEKKEESLTSKIADTLIEDFIEKEEEKLEVCESGICEEKSICPECGKKICECDKQSCEESLKTDVNTFVAGTDNAVVDCKVAKVIAHCEDEKPVDCLGEKKPLEKPLTEAKDLATIPGEVAYVLSKHRPEIESMCEITSKKTPEEIKQFLIGTIEKEANDTNSKRRIVSEIQSSKQDKSGLLQHVFNIILGADHLYAEPGKKWRFEELDKEACESCICEEICESGICELKENLDADMIQYNAYIDYLKHMLKQDEEALEKAKKMKNNEFAVKVIEKRIAADKEDLEAALPKIVKEKATEDKLPNPEEVDLTKNEALKEEKCPVCGDELDGKEPCEKCKKELEEEKCEICGKDVEEPCKSEEEAKDCKNKLEEAEMHIMDKKEFEAAAEKAGIEKPVHEEVAKESLTEAELPEAEVEKMLDSKEFQTPVSEAEVEALLADEPVEESCAKPFLETIEEIKDEAIEKCITESLTNVYENVDNFKLTDCELHENKLVISGDITFKSGNVKPTTYVFTEAEVDNRNFKLVGMNESFDKNGTFVLNGCLEDDGTLLIAEGLSYNYHINDNLIEGFVTKN